MKIVELPTERIRSPDWNPNEMDPEMSARLRRSIKRFGLLVPLVVRPVEDGIYETVGGAQRLAALMEADVGSAPCVVVTDDDDEARLLCQALNHIAGEDDPGLRAELLRRLLTTLTGDDLLTILPETRKSLHALASLGRGDMAAQLMAWQRSRDARLLRFGSWLSQAQREVVVRVLGPFLERVPPGDTENPNCKGQALYRLCLTYEELSGGRG